MKTTSWVLVVILVVIFGKSFSGYAFGKSPVCDSACHERRALMGDGISARHLAELYLKKDRSKMLHWYQIGAENGDVNSQYNFAHFLSVDSVGSDDCYRAIFWFNSAASKGHVESKARAAWLMQGLRTDGYKNGCLKHMLAAP